MELFETILLVGLVITAISAILQKKLINAVIIFMAFGMIMSVLWMLLQAPDLAITEAAVGAGVTGILFILTLKKIKALREIRDEAKPEKQSDEIR